MRLRWPCAGMIFVALGCKPDAKKDAAADTASADKEDDDTSSEGSDIERGTLTARQGETTISWRVTPGGEVWGLAAQRGAEVNPSDVEGALEARGLSSNGNPIRASIKESSGLLHADLGSLDPTLTEVRYSVKVKGETITGVLHVPSGGTVPIVQGADNAARARTSGAKGPHGGVVQAAGDAIFEIVGCRDSGEVRAYVLDRELRQTKVGKRTLRIALCDGASELVDLRAVDDGDDYFSGMTSIRSDPRMITLIVNDHDRVEDVLVGYEAGTAIPTGPSARTLPIFVADSCDVLVDRPRGKHDEDEDDERDDLREHSDHGPGHDHGHGPKGKHKRKH